MLNFKTWWPVIVTIIGLAVYTLGSIATDQKVIETAVLYSGFAGWLISFACIAFTRESFLRHYMNCDGRGYNVVIPPIAKFGGFLGFITGCFFIVFSLGHGGIYDNTILGLFIVSVTALMYGFNGGFSSNIFEPRLATS